MICFNYALQTETNCKINNNFVFVTQLCHNEAPAVPDPHRTVQHAVLSTDGRVHTLTERVVKVSSEKHIMSLDFILITPTADCKASA